MESDLEPLAIGYKSLSLFSKLWFRRLVLARIDLSTVLIEGPERVPEQTRRVVLLLERDEALPVLTERGGHAGGRLVASEELCVAALSMMTL
jgi:hypothetical protein